MYSWLLLLLLLLLLLPVRRTLLRRQSAPREQIPQFLVTHPHPPPFALQREPPRPAFQHLQRAVAFLFDPPGIVSSVMMVVVMRRMRMAAARRMMSVGLLVFDRRQIFVELRSSHHARELDAVAGLDAGAFGVGVGVDGADVGAIVDF